MFAEDHDMSNRHQTIAEFLIRNNFEQDSTEAPLNELRWGSMFRSIGLDSYAPVDLPIFTSISTWFHSQRDDRLEGIILLLRSFAEDQAIPSERLQQVEAKLRQFFEMKADDTTEEYRPRITFENGKKQKRKVRVRAVEPSLLRVSTDIDGGFNGKDCRGEGIEQACELYILKKKGDFFFNFD